MTKCERIRISGRVQGVGFRAATLDEARRLEIHGWVRNLPDGRVEVLAQAESSALEQFCAWLQQGPPAARVSHLERSSETPADPAQDFHIR
jgi:acylphosphatase